MNTRQEYNKKILAKILTAPWLTISIKEKLMGLIEKYPDQRWGQLFVNYIFPDFYEEGLFSNVQEIMDYFNWSYDPFFEESKETYENLKKAITKENESDPQTLREVLYEIQTRVNDIRIDMKKRNPDLRCKLDNDLIDKLENLNEYIYKILH